MIHEPPPLIDEFIDCESCEGVGTVPDEFPNRVNRPGEEQRITCQDCGGSGEKEIQVCQRCRKPEYNDCGCWLADESKLEDLMELARS